MTLPIHSYFLPKSERSPKELEYRERIFAVLKGRTLSMNELAKAMGLKPEARSNIRTSVLSLEKRHLVCVIRDTDDGVQFSIKGFLIVDNWEEILMEL